MISRLFFDAHTHIYIYIHIQRKDPLTRRASMQYYRYPTTYNCEAYSTYTFYAPAYFIQIHIHLFG